ncbi:MAG: aminotransferase class I/II-fold pyridoxal phosphate-dependent enzyme [Bacteroidota bacterium]
MHLSQKLERRATIWQNYSSFRGQLHHTELKGPVGSRMYFQDREYIIWCINNYLGLMGHPEGIKAAAEVAQEYGASYPHSVRLTAGHTAQHDHLEEQLSDFLQKEDTMLLNVGFQGVMSVIDALTDRHDTILYDRNVHACLIDGVRLHNGRKFAFQHNSVVHLEQQIKRALKTHNPNEGMMIVLVDGLYSMHGGLAPLDEIVALKKKYGFALLVDDSHGLGVFGNNGRGAPEYFGVEDEVDIYICSFTKIFGNIGGFVSGKKEHIEYLRFTVRSQIFSRTLPLSMVAAVTKNLEVLRKEPERRYTLWRNTKLLQEGLRDLDINFGDTVSPITPVRIYGSLHDGLEVLSELRKLGVFSYVVGYPVVEKGSCLIRMVVTQDHSQEDIWETLDAFKKVKSQFPKRLTNFAFVGI